MASSFRQSSTGSQRRAPSPVNRNVKIITTAQEDIKCILCTKSTVDELNLGRLYSRDDVTCHYFCMLFCSNLRQNGEDDCDGIMGFLLKDIKNEVARVNLKSSKNYAFYKCRYCKKPGATIGCCVESCPVLFHFPCGLKNGVNYQFAPATNFACYCKHHMKENLPKEITRLMRSPSAIKDSTCDICFSSFDVRENPPVVGTCMDHEAVYHKKCIQEYAANAGYSFKCPGCANKERFKTDVELQGVYVPDRDAAWEKEENAFGGLKQRYSECDAETCKCPYGRKYHEKDVASNWRLLRCFDCAAAATHVGCYTGVLECSTARWICPTCSKIDDRVKNLRRQGKLAAVEKTSRDDSSCDEDDSSVIVLSSGPSSPIRSRSPFRQERNGRTRDSSPSSMSSDESLFIPIKATDRATNAPSKPSDVEENATNNGESQSEAKRRDSDSDVICISSSNDSEDTGASSDDSLFIRVRQPKKRRLSNRQTSSQNLD